MADSNLNPTAPGTDAPEQNISDLIRVRREKLKALQDSGRDPFTIRRFDVTHHSADIKEHFDELEEKEVAVAGDDTGGVFRSTNADRMKQRRIRTTAALLDM